MKKVYLSLLAAATMVPAMAQTTVTPQWGNLLAGDKSHFGVDATLTNDGNLVWFNLLGSTNQEQVITLNGTQVATGSLYSGNSYNNGLSLIKTNTAGEVQWSTWSTAGELASNQGGIVATADGGTTIVAKVRHSQNYGTSPITIVNQAGQTTTLDWTLEEATSSRYYKGLVMHLDAQGNVAWSRFIDVSTAPQPNATSAAYQALTPDGLDINAVTSDSEGNLYLVGRFRNPVTFNKADGTTIEIAPRNTATWNGDTQTSVGDLYVAKLDANGYALKVITASGDAAVNESLATTAIDGNNLYIQGLVKGAAEGTTLTLGDKQITASGNGDLLIAQLDTDLNVNWARAIYSSYAGTVIQKAQLNVVGSDLVFTGKVRANFVDGDNSLNASSLTRDGAIMVFNTVNGEWVNAVNIGTNQAGAYGAFTLNNDEDNIYTFKTALMGAYTLEKRNRNTLEVVESWNLYSAVDDVFPIVLDGNTLYTNARISRANTLLGNQDFSYTATTQKRAQLMAAFTVEVAQDIPGDVNGDGTVDVSDVNEVVNVMLSGDENAAADVNGDGVVDVSDVNAVINIMLGK